MQSMKAGFPEKLLRRCCPDQQVFGQGALDMHHILYPKLSTPQDLVRGPCPCGVSLIQVFRGDAGQADPLIRVLLAPFIQAEHRAIR